MKPVEIFPAAYVPGQVHYRTADFDPDHMYFWDTEIRPILRDREPDPTFLAVSKETVIRYSFDEILDLQGVELTARYTS